MRQLHYFTVKEDLQIEWANAGDPYGKLEQQVDGWLSACDVRDYIKTETTEHPITTKRSSQSTWKTVWAIEAPTWSFRREHDAVAFRIAFGDIFDYQLCDEWDDNEW